MGAKTKKPMKCMKVVTTNTAMKSMKCLAKKSSMMGAKRKTIMKCMKVVTTNTPMKSMKVKQAVIEQAVIERPDAPDPWQWFYSLTPNDAHHNTSLRGQSIPCLKDDPMNEQSAMVSTADAALQDDPMNEQSAVVSTADAALKDDPMNEQSAVVSTAVVPLILNGKSLQFLHGKLPCRSARVRPMMPAWHEFASTRDPHDCDDNFSMLGTSPWEVRYKRNVSKVPPFPN